MKRAYAVSLETLGCVLTAQSAYTEAVPNLRESYMLLTDLVNRDTTNVSWKNDLAKCCLNLGIALSNLRTVDATGEALKRLDEGVTLTSALRPVINGDADVMLESIRRAKANVLGTKLGE